MTTTTAEVEAFYNAKKEDALQECLDEGFIPFFMPGQIEARLSGQAPWDKYAHTISARITGKTKQGAKVVVFAHVPTSLGTPKGIRKAKKDGLVNYAARFPQNELQNLVDADGKTDQEGKRVIWVGDYDVHKNAHSGVINVADALAHPQTVPFIGDEDRAQRHLVGHQEAYETDQIGVWHADDLHKDGPLARLLRLGLYCGGLCGYVDDYGRFFGVRENATGAKKVMQPSLRDILQFAQPFVADVAREDFEQGLRNLYRQ